MSVSLTNAKVIAQRGGLIGMWTSRFNFKDPRAYVAALEEAVAELGEDHVAFGTDMQGLAPTHSVSKSFVSRCAAAGSAPARQGEAITTRMIQKWNHTMMDAYSGMREVVNLMLSSNMPETTVRKVAGENYARLLKTGLR
jgi:microsomal dipeptidase-like Zn-dependent dipeptidase